MEIPSDLKSICRELFVSDDTPTQSDTIIPSASGGDGVGGETSKGRAEGDHHVQQQQTQGGCASGGGGGDGDGGVADQGNTTTAQSGNRLLPQPTPGGSNHQSPALTWPHHDATPPSSTPSAHRHRTRERSSMKGSPNRTFDDNETRSVVEDYFARGKYPGVGEVRRRTVNSELRASRTVRSIWKKAKRLQASGRWTEYALP
ncbi:unnamed protein product [Mesocestoides corti]|uniref:Homeobox domain-containing protein n=1 Tax=Mesocestoides corti TaxID=53468 RepID=A0A0R3UB20_MESCO|nr:unnamed protein product [Mesocestoides corti]